MDANNSPRILITRLSAIGDTVLTMPVLTTIREHYPEAFIAWAVESPSNQFLEIHPDVDEVIKIPKSWASKTRNWIDLRKKLKSYQFDYVVDPQCITKSAMLGWLSGAKSRIGIKGKWGREFSPWLNNRLVQTTSPHIVRRSVELLSAMGIEGVDLDSLRFGLPVCPQSLESINEKLKPLDLGESFVAINPGAGWASRQWPPDRWGSVASYIYRTHKLKSVIVWAGESELEMARGIRAIDPDASEIAPASSLLELAALGSQASMFLSSDTGPLHIAAAMGTPTIGLFGTTIPEESGAYGEGHIAVQKWHQRGTSRERRKAENLAMQDILAADVFKAVDQMVQQVSCLKAA